MIHSVYVGVDQPIIGPRPMNWISREESGSDLYPLTQTELVIGGNKFIRLRRLVVSSEPIKFKNIEVTPETVDEFTAGVMVLARFILN